MPFSPRLFRTLQPLRSYRITEMQYTKKKHILKNSGITQTLTRFS